MVEQTLDYAPDWFQQIQIILRQRFPTRSSRTPGVPQQDFGGYEMRFLSVSLYVLGCSFTLEPRFMKTCLWYYSKEHHLAKLFQLTLLI